MDNSEKRRWEDRDPEFVELLEKLKVIKQSERDSILVDIKDLIMDFDSELIDRNVMEFPLTAKRRWYDSDPNSWLVINSLKYVDEDLTKKIIIHLKRRLQA